MPSIPPAQWGCSFWAMERCCQLGLTLPGAERLPQRCHKCGLRPSQTAVSGCPATGVCRIDPFLALEIALCQAALCRVPLLPTEGHGRRGAVPAQAPRGDRGAPAPQGATPRQGPAWAWSTATARRSWDGAGGHGWSCSGRDALPRLTLGVIRLQLLHAGLAKSLIQAVRRQLSPGATKRPRRLAYKQTLCCAEGRKPRPALPGTEDSPPPRRDAGREVRMWSCWGKPPWLLGAARPAERRAAHGRWWPSPAGRKGLAVLSKPSPAKLQITFSGRNSFRAGDARSVYKGQANSEYCK